FEIGKIRRYLWAIFIMACAVAIGLGIHASATAIHNRRESPEGALFLTSYLENGKIAAARDLSEVRLLKEQADVTAHSGYFTIDKNLGSHLFFLFVRAQEDSHSAPLLLWLQGGPGKSSLFGQFLDNGPLGIDATGRLYRRLPTIQKNMNIIYLDEPVGAGFSYTEDPRGYVKTLGQMSEAMEKFLQQFLSMFPEFRNRDFYIAGESYGARATVGISHLLQTTNPEEVPLKLRGVICGVGFLGPILDTMDSTQFLFYSGMLDERGAQLFSERFKLLRNLVRANATAALGLLTKTIGAEGGPRSQHTLFQNLTGYNSHSSAIVEDTPDEFKQFYKFAATPEFKRAFHVDEDRVLDAQREIVTFNLAHQDMLADISNRLQDLLNGQRVLLYTGQMDTLFPAANLEKYFKSLSWDGAAEFRNATRTPWYTRCEPRRFAGYVTSVRNMKYVQVARAGHHAAFDEPAAVYDMMDRFFGNGRPSCS
ncbi:unnamed protein product, partial [Ixodes pacificus]